MKAQCLIIELLLILSLWTIPLEAQQELSVGARPLGIAAYTAIGDDANAVRWNPAGLTQLRRSELTTMWTELFNSGFTQSYLGYALPITDKLTVGANWASVRFEDVELGYSQTLIHIAGGYRPFDWLSCGLSIKSIFSATKLDNFSQGDTRRFDGNIGVLFHPASPIRLAFVLRDVANTDVTHEYQKQISHEAISVRQGIIGLAYQTPLSNLVVAVETDVALDDRLRFGGEYQFRKWSKGLQAALRAGFHRDWNTGERITWAVGGSIGLSVSSHADLLFEYAYLDSPLLPATHRFALRVPFELKPAAVEILQLRAPPLFASLYRRYAEVPTVSVLVQNKQDAPLKPQISIVLEGYTPPTGVVPRNLPDLGGKAKQTFTVPIILSSKILNAPQGKIPVTVEVTCPEERRLQQVRKTFPILVYPSGKIPFNPQERVKPYVAFITHEDLPVVTFARKIVERYDEAAELSAVQDSGQLEKVREDLRKFFIAMQLYESLRSLGVYYRPDANEAYNEISTLAAEGEGYFVDSVRYPREFLTSDDFGGDCDDWSVLYASLLESQGISTALVDVPGHLFVMFNTGIPVQNADVIGLTPDRYIVWKDTIWDETVWIPLDAPDGNGDSAGNRSFYEAWGLGLRQCQTNQIPQQPNTEKRIVSVREAQKNYPPATWLQPPKREITLPPKAVADRHLAETLRKFKREWEAFMKEVK